MPQIFRELDYSTPRAIGATEMEFPFEDSGDFETRLFTETYKQTIAAFMRDRLTARYLPGVATHPVERGFFLLSTSKPSVTPTGLYQFTRTWSNLPRTLYEPASVLLPRPSLHDVKVTVSSTDYFAVSFDEGRTSHLFTTGRKSVSAVGAITAATVNRSLAAETVTDFSSGTFTITDTGAAATSPSFTSGGGVIEGGIRGACAAITGLTVTKGIGTLTISWTGGVRSIETTTAGVYIEGSVGSGSITFRVGTAAVTNAETEIISPPTRSLTTSSAHSGTAGDWMAAWNNDKLVGIIKPTAASGSSVTIEASESPWNVNGLAITHLGFASQAAYRIANGPVDCSARTVRRFYLPGVSSGIVNAADIPGFVSVTQDPISWMTALIPQLTTASEDNWAVHSTEGISRWLGGPIYEKDVLEVQLQDAVKSLSVSA